MLSFPSFMFECLIVHKNNTFLREDEGGGSVITMCHPHYSSLSEHSQFLFIGLKNNKQTGNVKVVKIIFVMNNTKSTSLYVVL